MPTSRSITMLVALYGALADLAQAFDGPASSALSKRQQDSNSNCSVFGIDYQNGGSYFIDTSVNVDFTLVSQFEGCKSDLEAPISQCHH